MALAGVAEIFLGVRAEQANLEDIAQPLTSEEAEEDAGDEQGGAEGADEGGEAAAARSEEGRAAEARMAARSERRREAARARRYRPGPGRAMYAPWMLTSSTSPGDADERTLDREVEAIVAAVADHGEVRTDVLARALRAGRWGPGRFRAALREAVADGRVVRASGRMVRPPG